MSSIVVAGDTSGTITLAAPAVSGSSILTLPVATDTLIGKATTDVLTNKSIAVGQLTGTLPIANGGTGSTATTYASLTANVSGTLPVANGGTGLTSAGTSGNVLVSNGSVWTSAPPASGGGSGSGVTTGLSIALAMVMGF